MMFAEREAKPTMRAAEIQKIALAFCIVHYSGVIAAGGLVSYHYVTSFVPADQVPTLVSDAYRMAATSIVGVFQENKVALFWRACPRR